MSAETTINKTLFELIDAIPKPLPSSAARIEEVLGVPLLITTTDNAGPNYASRPFSTADGFRIEALNLRMVPYSYELKHPGVGSILSLDIDTESCVLPEPLKTRYAVAQLKGPISDDIGLVYWRAVVPWGKFSVGVRTLRGGKKCVASVVINNSREEQ
ncbi:hypothetical protein [Dyella caseinilytica]|uniref:Uncharacterized protein n=1 Tax=Dyella caseinilytica TaxID=1849581 RepID=A0ABX7GQA5_9GAMM|nr:hypothetical protein [Dyella caseinilytica]QRN52612.1 hypothetical protein ISN74_14205 [Dyella caseinilytica]